MTKKEVVSEILKIEKVDTYSNLLSKKLPELEAILEGLSPVEDSVAPEPVVAPELDMKALMAQMKADMMAELKEEARKEVEAEMKSEEVKPVRKREIDRFEPIPVMSVTKGGLIYISKKTGAEWNWGDFGDVEYLEFQELQTMRSGQKKFLDEPHIIVLDDDAVNYLGLTKMYEGLIDVNTLGSVVKLNQSDFEDIIEKSPKGIRHTIISILKDKVENDDEDVSIKKINYINKRFNLDIGKRG